MNAADSPDHAWSFGLDRVPDALESLIRIQQVLAEQMETRPGPGPHGSAMHTRPPVDGGLVAFRG